MATVLITGANRGIGLEFVRQLAGNGYNIFACCRNPQKAEQLNQFVQNHGNITIYPLDVTNPSQIKQLAEQLSGTPIDILINNAGYYGEKGSSLGHIDPVDWIEVLKVNTIAPLLVSEAFTGHVAQSKSKKIVILSSKMGSLEDNTSGGSYLYRSSKAGANQVGKSLAIDLASYGIKVLVLHPGWVQTDMGGPNALIDTKTSVEGMISQIEKLDQAMSGHFVAFDGQEIAW